MRKEILVNAGAAELRTAVVEDGRLQELFMERLIGNDDAVLRRRGGVRSGQTLVGKIILGRVQRVLPGMQAAFVEIGLERAGFLGGREACCLADSPGFDEDRSPKIGECVREGEEVLVQVIKDPIAEKGARLSANITIPGRLLVLVPNQPGVSLSRRIEEERERARLTALCAQMRAEAGSSLLPNAGYIVRSAAIGTELSDLRADAERLAEIWRQLRARRRQAKPPATLHRDLDPIERMLRDEVDANTVRVLIDDREALEAAHAYCRRAMPEMADKLELFTGPGSLFDAYGLEDELELLTSPRVPLASGGWMTIEGTEGLTAIDVNSGRFTEAASLEEMSLRVNLDAAEDIGRQLRLREIGGLVVVDFIHLEERENIARVLAQLGASLGRDRRPSQLSGMSEFGLVEITRKRLRDPLMNRMTERCRCCHGQGRTQSCETVAVGMIRQVERAAAAAPGKRVIARAAPDVVRWTEAHAEEIRAGLARRGVPQVSFVPRPEFERSDCDVTTE